MNGPVTEQTIRAAIEPWRKLNRRDAWKPIVEVRDAITGDTGSQFGGRPLLAENEAWPTCGKCASPLQLFVQLNLATLPKSSPFHTDRAQWLQFFHCASPFSTSVDWCPAQVDTFDSSSPLGGTLLRILSPDHGPLRVASVSEGFEPFPCRSITRWDRFDDYPHPEDFDRLGLNLTYEFPPKQPILTTVRWPAGNVLIERSDVDNVAELISNAATHDKLGGWPNWVQSAAYRACRRCGATMDYVFQIDSEDNVPYMFGDCGIGHISRCPNHPDVLAFGWDCC